MFPVWQTDILVKHQAMDYRQYTIHTVYGQQDNPTEILRPDN